MSFLLSGKPESGKKPTFIRRLFYPAIQLMNRLTYPKKFILVGIFFTLPFCLVFFLLIGEIDSRIHFSEKEIMGNKMLKVLMPVLHDLQYERGIEYAFKNNADFISKNMLEESKKNIQRNIDRASEVEKQTRPAFSMEKAWGTFLETRRNRPAQEASVTSKEAFAEDTRQIKNILEIMTDVADRSNLILDPDLESYYLMESVVSKLPILTEQVGQARGWGSAVVVLDRILSSQDVFFLSNFGGVIAQIQEGVRYNFDVVFRENSSLRPRLEPLLHQSLDATDVFLKNIKERVLNVSHIKIQSKEYWAIGNTAITASVQLCEAASVALDEVLQKRIDRLSRQKALVVLFTMLMVLIVTYLVTAFYLALMETVNMLGHVSKRMVAGDTGEPIILTGVHDEMGQVIQSFNLVAEGLSRKANELSASEKLLFSTLQALPVVVFCKDIKRNFQWTVWNKKAEEVFGIKAEECLGKTDYDFFPKEQADWFRKKDIEASQTTETIDIPEELVSTKNGPVFLHTRKIVIRDASGEPVLLLGVSEDITARKEIDRILKESGEKLRQMADSVPGVVYQYSLDKQGTQKFLYMSAFADNLFGVSSKEIEKDFNLMWNLILPEDVENLIQTIQKSAETLKSWTCQFRIKDKQGKIKYIQGDSTPEKKQDDGTIIWNGVLSDVTPQKILEQQLSQSQKMEAVGSLAGGIAHDFNNLLTVINGYADLIVATLKPEDPLRPKVEEIQKAGGRAAGLTAQLLAFSRRQVIQAQVVDINEQIVDMDQMIRRLITEQIELVTLQANDLWMVKVDPGQFQQIVMNLVVNARDAMSGIGKITIETLNKDLSEDYITEQVKIPAGKYVVLAVSDTGCGMSDEVKRRIFEPFFTTKEQGKGTGLGLATCFGIVQQANGYVYVHSVVNQGSTFKVYLPFAGTKEIDFHKEKTEAPLPGGKETILLVEDESGLREFAGELLRNLGYEVLEAENGEEALRVIERNPKNKIQLVLTDVIMPRMGGKELSKKIQELYPGMKILFMSGYTGSEMTGALAEEVQFLQKPFSLKQLALKMREVLDGVS